MKEKRGIKQGKDMSSILRIHYMRMEAKAKARAKAEGSTKFH